MRPSSGGSSRMSNWLEPAWARAAIATASPATGTGRGRRGAGRTEPDARRRRRRRQCREAEIRHCRWRRSSLPPHLLCVDAAGAASLQKWRRGSPALCTAARSLARVARGLHRSVPRRRRPRRRLGFGLRVWLRLIFAALALLQSPSWRLGWQLAVRRAWRLVAPSRSGAARRRAWSRRCPAPASLASCVAGTYCVRRVTAVADLGPRDPWLTPPIRRGRGRRRACRLAGAACCRRRVDDALRPRPAVPDWPPRRDCRAWRRCQSAVGVRRGCSSWLSSSWLFLSP